MSSISGLLCSFISRSGICGGLCFVCCFLGSDGGFLGFFCWL
ncbi:hypothetical protein [Moraxella lacunata]